jgi:hypothetical protein
MIFVKRFCSQISLGIALAAVIGCKPKVYQVQTHLTSQGEFYRDILQPLDESLPPEAWKQNTAPSSQPTEQDVNPSWKSRWKNFKFVDQPEDAENGRYIQASADFKNAKEIPSSFYVPAKPLVDRASTDEISHDIDDYVLFGIDRWKEDITETISLPEYVEAIEDLIRMLLPALLATFEELYGSEYDLKAYQDYLRGPVVQALRQYCLWVYQYHPLAITQVNETALLELRKILAAVEFELPITDDRKINIEAIEGTWDKFVHKLFESKVRHQSGRPLTSEEVKQLWQRIQNDIGTKQEQPVEPAAQNAESKPSKEETPRFMAAFQNYMEDHYGKDYVEDITGIMTKLGGAHNNNPAGVLWCLFSDFPLDFNGKKFTYSFELPGPVIETNGVRVSENIIRWQFTKGELFPNGYSMHARSIRWHREAEEKLFGRVVLKDIASVIRIMDTMAPKGSAGADYPIYMSLQKALEQGDLKPIEALTQQQDEGVRKAARAIMNIGKPQ